MINCEWWIQGPALKHVGGILRNIFSELFNEPNMKEVIATNLAVGHVYRAGGNFDLSDAKELDRNKIVLCSNDGVFDLLRRVHVVACTALPPSSAERKWIEGVATNVLGDERAFKDHAMKDPRDNVLKAVHVQNYVLQILGDHFRCITEYEVPDTLPSPLALPKAL